MRDLHPLEEKLAGQWPPSEWRDVTVLVAVSGGADSVALLRGLLAVRQPGEGRIVVAHFNHGLRGDESDGDEAFVAALCRQLDVPHEIGCHGREAHQQHAPASVRDDSQTAGNARGSGPRASEEESREWRYGFLRKTAARVGARFVATAHTADDQAETVLHRVLRGTGITGLAGMRTYRQLIPGVAIVRPMLSVRRAEVVEYLKAIGQDYREDATNANLGFTRNRLRHELLPQIAEAYNPNIVEALNRLASMAGDVQTLVDQLVGRLADTCTQKSSAEEVAIDCRPLYGANPFLVRQLLIRIWTDHAWSQQAMSYEKWAQLARLAAEQNPAKPGAKIMLPGSILAERKGDLLVLLAAASAGGRSLS